MTDFYNETDKNMKIQAISDRLVIHARVIEERKELKEKINKLRVFINSDSQEYNNLSLQATERLCKQFKVMEEYEEILCKRIMLDFRE